jgi:hypothetical protein
MNSMIIIVGSVLAIVAVHSTAGSIYTLINTD